MEANGAIDQNGNMDPTTESNLVNSLEDSIQNSPQRKIYALTDLNITNDTSASAELKYVSTFHNLYPKNVVDYTILDVLRKFAPDSTGNNADPSVLPELDPIIKQFSGLETGMLAMPVPQPLATAHLNIINALEGILENLNDIQLYNTDPIVALGGISKYEANNTLLNSALGELTNTIQTINWKN